MVKVLTTRLNWLSGDGPESEIVLSCRMRIARNLHEFPFEIKLDEVRDHQLLDFLKVALGKVATGQYVDMSKLSPLEVHGLLESHLVSPAFIQSERRRALYVLDDSCTSVMLNEEDHLRLQSVTPGLSLSEAYRRVSGLESRLDEEVEFAFDEEFGYLSSCPTNMGNGLRAVIFLHLPALVLTKEVEKILRGVLQIGLAVRGIYGEGSEIKGNLFQISNQITLGQKEEEVLEIMEKIARQLIDFERKARDTMLENAHLELHDKIFRAEAILKSARAISTDEVVNLTSAVRLGVGLGLIKGLTIRTLNEILVFTRSANLQLLYDRTMEAPERDQMRAEYIRGRLAQAESAR